jgi:hypothetical protein
MLPDNLSACSNNNVITPLILTKYYRMGFKPVPVGKDSKTPAISSTNDIYNDPNYWTEEKLIKECSRFSNIAPTFGIIRTSESETNENEKLYLNCLDIDSDNVLI